MTHKPNVNEDHFDSLKSAELVQQGLLPKSRHFERLFKEHFVLYLPQNILSGDFFWVGCKGNLKYLVVGDCAGHGISAALISVLMLNLCEYAIMNKSIKKTNKILKEIDKKFIESFTQLQINTQDNPWVELSIICIDEENKKLFFSSANRKILHINSNSEVILHKGSNYPIGGWQIETNREFDSKTINYSIGDQIYLGSDGFQDQFGGPLSKKYKSKRLHSFLTKNSHLKLFNQKEALHQEFLSWKKEHDQVDDICIIGVKL